MFAPSGMCEHLKFDSPGTDGAGVCSGTGAGPGSSATFPSSWSSSKLLNDDCPGYDGFESMCSEISIFVFPTGSGATAIPWDGLTGIGSRQMIWSWTVISPTWIAWGWSLSSFRKVWSCCKNWSNIWSLCSISVHGRLWCSCDSFGRSCLRFNRYWSWPRCRNPVVVLNWSNRLWSCWCRSCWKMIGMCCERMFPLYQTHLIFQSLCQRNSDDLELFHLIQWNQWEPNRAIQCELKEPRGFCLPSCPVSAGWGGLSGSYGPSSVPCSPRNIRTQQKIQLLIDYW